jgi:hypothetical protein
MTDEGRSAHTPFYVWDDVVEEFNDPLYVFEWYSFLQPDGSRKILMAV